MRFQVLGGGWGSSRRSRTSPDPSFTTCVSLLHSLRSLSEGSRTQVTQGRQAVQMKYWIGNLNQNILPHTSEYEKFWIRTSPWSANGPLLSVSSRGLASIHRHASYVCAKSLLLRTRSHQPGLSHSLILTCFHPSKPFNTGLRLQKMNLGEVGR